MNASTAKSLVDVRDMPIEKPLDPLPAIFTDELRTGFSTARKVYCDGREPREGQRARDN